MGLSSKGFVVVGVGETQIPLCRDATSSEADWEAFYANASHEGRLEANRAKNDGGWCVTVSREDIDETSLDDDPAVRVYASVD